MAGHEPLVPLLLDSVLSARAFAREEEVYEEGYVGQNAAAGLGYTQKNIA